MVNHHVTCVYDGDTFVGNYGLIGAGETEQVSVEFNGRVVSTLRGKLRPEFIAKALLSELVRDHVLEPTRVNLNRDLSRSFPRTN